MSAVWTYFKTDSEGPKTATCDVCKLSILYGGKTMNLIGHLNNRQPVKYSEFTLTTQTHQTDTESYVKNERETA